MKEGMPRSPLVPVCREEKAIKEPLFLFSHHGLVLNMIINISIQQEGCLFSQIRCFFLGLSVFSISKNFSFLVSLVFEKVICTVFWKQ